MVVIVVDVVVGMVREAFVVSVAGVLCWYMWMLTRNGRWVTNSHIFLKTRRHYRLGGEFGAIPVI